MRTRELMRRHAVAFEQMKETMELQRQAFDRQAEAFDRQARALDHQENALRKAVADLHHFGETLERRTDAVVDTCAALVAEIRGWRSESGPGSA
jgi:hypothetical protein